ncbi:head GIN domain-containing protein [Sediminibacter sp. Hel_I_10]|uniref:head GIN domain-containing protein n=1 Tax=Sediminibacter sp. Hel_I_10 TaxID=1392490 RepID=UPI00047CD8D7|nr:head GIN domain-containing protein [Sediminibacter sp. Hel_I_10]
MTTIAKFTITLILSLLLVSCNFDANWNTGTKGNGEVTSVERPSTQIFNKIEASRGLDVYITQNDVASIRVEADQNLQDLITTTIENGVLIITTKENIGSATSKKVFVNVKELEEISASSGSYIYGNNTITSKSLKLNSASGADIELELDVTHLSCYASSGSDLKVSGKANEFIAKAASGSDIIAGDLLSNTCNASASSGADVTVNTIKKLTVTANSGGDITYHGNPELLEKNGVTSGTVRRE